MSSSKVMIVLSGQKGVYLLLFWANLKQKLFKQLS
tara:strand:+ start:348 stop:452 length:105 start_codon:yes stop_codon:yes gene_type:complete